MRIVLVTETLHIGGAETFVLRLATALRARGQSVSLFVMRGDLTNHALVQSIAPDVPLEEVRPTFLRLILKADGLLFLLGLKFSLVRWMQVRQLRSHLANVGAQVVHSHLITADLVAARACEAICLPWVTTMHGDYLALEGKGVSRAARIQDFNGALREVENSVRHIVCITDQQTAMLRRRLPHADSDGRISKIYNGYALAQGSEVTVSDQPEALSAIPPDAFVIGMVARGVRDKGWEVMISAFQQLDLPDAWLVLVGDSDYLQTLKGDVRHPRVVFTGNVVEPLRYIARFDVGCLPSRYKAESLPTVIVEYLVLGKPVIATDLGEVAHMIGAGIEGAAGLLIRMDSVEVMASQMKEAIERLYRDPAERKCLQNCARVAAGKFNMGRCVDEYLAVYEAARR